MPTGKEQGTASLEEASQYHDCKAEFEAAEEPSEETSNPKSEEVDDAADLQQEQALPRQQDISVASDEASLQAAKVSRPSGQRLRLSACKRNLPVYSIKLSIHKESLFNACHSSFQCHDGSYLPCSCKDIHCILLYYLCTIKAANK